MFKLSSGASSGPAVFFRFSFMPFWMDLCKTVMASRFPLFPNVPRCDRKFGFRICFPVLFAASFSSLIVCVGLPWRQFGQTSFQVLLAVPIGKRHQKTIHMLQMFHICYIPYICFNSLGISLVSFVFGQRKGNVLQ